MAQAEAPCAFQTTLDGQPSDKQMRKIYTVKNGVLFHWFK